MTGTELYTLTTNLLGGQSLDSDMFYQLLNVAKNMREMKRDWMILRAIDSSITFAASDDYTSTKSLPSYFLRVFSFLNSLGAQVGPYILTSASSKVPLQPIKFLERYDYKDLEGYFYLDIRNAKIGRSGLTAGTLYLPYLKGTADIAAGTTWEFPTFAHPLLAYDVAVQQKGGIDWDTVNANQVPYNEKRIREIESALAFWDAELQRQELGV